MELERRSLLVGTGTVVVMGIAGCLSSDDTGQAADVSNSNEEDEEGQSAGENDNDQPDPQVMDIYYPEPRGVDIDNEKQSGDTYEFTVEIENTSTDGNIGVMLVWLESPNDDVYGPNSDPVQETRRERFFSSGERRAISVTSEARDGYNGYGFRVWAAEVGAEIENRGGRGRVEVRLMEGNEIIEDAKLVMDAGETTTFDFDSNFNDVDPEKIDIEVESAE